MTFDWSKNLEFAKEQVCVDEHGNVDEAACRAAISRAYYAAFCLSRNYLCHNGDYTLRHAYHEDRFAKETIGPIHQYVIKEFDLDPENEPEKAVISETLKALKARRVYADYKNHHDSQIVVRVQESLEHAQHVIDDLKRL